jgi:hypothetical protein
MDAAAGVAAEKTVVPGLISGHDGVVRLYGRASGKLLHAWP